MKIFSIEDNLNEMSKLVFWWKEEKYNLSFAENSTQRADQY